MKIEVKTLPLTIELFKQMEDIDDWSKIRPLFRLPDGEGILGWVSGSVTGDDGRWLIVKLEGRYFRARCLAIVCDRFSQIYLQ